MYLDTDVIYALLKPSDRHFAFAKKIVSSNETIYSSVVMTLELELIVKREISDYLSQNILDAVLKKVPALSIVPLDKKIFAKSLELRQVFGLGIFDSLHAATALFHDKKIASTDEAFDRIAGLKRIKPLQN